MPGIVQTADHVSDQVTPEIEPVGRSRRSKNRPVSLIFNFGNV